MPEVSCYLRNLKCLASQSFNKYAIVSFTYFILEFGVQILSKFVQKNTKTMLKKSMITTKLRKLFILIPGHWRDFTEWSCTAELKISKVKLQQLFFKLENEDHKMINRALKPIELEVIDIYSYTSTSFPLKLLINNNKKKKRKWGGCYLSKSLHHPQTIERKCLTTWKETYFTKWYLGLFQKQTVHLLYFICAREYNGVIKMFITND